MWSLLELRLQLQLKQINNLWSETTETLFFELIPLLCVLNVIHGVLPRTWDSCNRLSLHWQATMSQWWRETPSNLNVTLPPAKKGNRLKLLCGGKRTRCCRRTVLGSQRSSIFLFKLTFRVRFDPNMNITMKRKLTRSKSLISFSTFLMVREADPSYAGKWLPILNVQLHANEPFCVRDILLLCIN